MKYTSIESVPLTISVNDFSDIVGVGRTTAYQLVRCGAIRSIRAGAQIRIPKDALVEYLGGTSSHKH